MNFRLLALLAALVIIPAYALLPIPLSEVSTITARDDPEAILTGPEPNKKPDSNELNIDTILRSSSRNSWMEWSLPLRLNPRKEWRPPLQPSRNPWKEVTPRR